MVDPNGVFATIGQIQATQRAVGGLNSEPEESSSSSESDSEDSEPEDCIIAAV